MSVLRSASFPPRWLASGPGAPIAPSVRACQSMERSKSHKVYKQLGLYSLKKKIEDAVHRAEMMAPNALEIEEARRIKQEEVLRDHSLWDDLAKSDQHFTALADAIRLINDLKDLRYKAEEAKLIMELAEMDVISHELFRQAYKATLDVNSFLEQYELSKFLSGPYDNEGACLTIKAGPEGIASEVWAEKLLRMYTRWAEKHGWTEYMYGYLSGERGVHRKICNSVDGSAVPRVIFTVLNIPHVSRPLKILNFLYIEMKTSCFRNNVSRTQLVAQINFPWPMYYEICNAYMRSSKSSTGRIGYDISCNGITKY
ncbi:peptide chain release factor [Musa troglodytarum]|uniref:Peptide chain release factor n=1 Tax=Musa troglodytarum TaxID=320322 RepID=A0A9E7G2T7_9LILI|nr:peptide chain release factor [Musa troglodytarum]